MISRKTAKIVKKVFKISVMSVTLVPSIYDANITAIDDKSLWTIFGSFLELNLVTLILTQQWGIAPKAAAESASFPYETHPVRHRVSCLCVSAGVRSVLLCHGGY